MGLMEILVEKVRTNSMQGMPVFNCSVLDGLISTCMIIPYQISIRTCRGNRIYVSDVFALPLAVRTHSS